MVKVKTALMLLEEAKQGKGFLLMEDATSIC